jgi:hypothetical protein
VFKRLASKLALPGWLLLLFDAAIRILDWAERLEFVKEKITSIMPWLHSALDAATSPTGQFCLVIAGFVFLLIVATRQEKRSKVDATSESPGLIGRVTSVAFIESDKQESGICVRLQITNTGPPTIADSWGIIFDFRGTPYAFAATHAADGKVLNIPLSNGKIITLNSSEMIYERITTPIPQGGRVSGYLFFKTKGISYAQLVSDRPMVTILFRDAAGREYRTPKTGEGSPTVLHEPGLEDPLAKVHFRQIKEQGCDKLIQEAEETIEAWIAAKGDALLRSETNERSLRWLKDATAFVEQAFDAAHFKNFKNTELTLTPGDIFNAMMKVAKAQNDNPIVKEIAFKQQILVYFRKEI